jgi:hypothetical protein
MQGLMKDLLDSDHDDGIETFLRLVAPSRSKCTIDGNRETSG